MAQHAGTPHFKNDEGHERIEIGVKEFMCVGATPPYDHPHVYLDMGDDDQIVCPYCSTLYVYNPELAPHETIPPNCFFDAQQAA
ncbi:MAG: zinc-finger domain-containing protein [Pseudomonadota bacterium]